MTAPVDADPPPSDGTSADACAPVVHRQPPGDLGRAYRIAFAETGTLEVVLPATEPIPVQQPARAAAARPFPRDAPRPAPGGAPTARRTTTSAPVPVQRTARLEAAPAPAAPATPAVRAAAERQLARRSRALLLGLAIGVVLGVVAVVVTGLLVASLDLLPR